MKRGGSKKTPPPRFGRRRRASPAIFSSRPCMRTASAAAPTETPAMRPYTFSRKTKLARANLSAKLWKGSRRSEREGFCLTSPVAAYILSLLRFLYRGGSHETSDSGISRALGMERGGGGVPGEG